MPLSRSFQGLVALGEKLITDLPLSRLKNKQSKPNQGEKFDQSVAYLLHDNFFQLIRSCLSSNIYLTTRSSTQ